LIAAVEFGFTFRAPEWLWLVPVPLLLLLYSHRRQRRVPLAAASLADGSLAQRLGLPPLPRSLRQRLYSWLPAVELIGLWLLLAALARPVQRLPLPPEREGSDILLCIDVSSSMLSTDLGTDTESTGAALRSRLAIALDAAAEFVAASSEDRVGVVTFARYADLRCPPTLDRLAVAELLAQIEPVTADGPEDATGIGTAIAFATEALRRAATSGKVVVLLTDGEENVATRATPREIAPLHAGQLARQLGVRVHTIVVGTGNPGPDGATVPLDTTAVQRIAAVTGGKFFLARDAAALRAIYRDIDAIEKTAFAEPRVLVREWFAMALGLALLLVGLAGWWTTSPRGTLP